MNNPRIFRYFKTSSEIIRLAVMMYVRYPLSLRNVEDLLHERGIDITHETVRFWWNRFGIFLLRRSGEIEFRQSGRSSIGDIPPAEAEERYYAMLDEPALAA